MKSDRFDRLVWAVLAGLGLALVAVIALGDRVGARVVRTMPAAGGAVAALGRVGLEFAQPMQADSVAANFSIEPAIPGVWRSDGLQGFFVPRQPFAPGTRYTARLAAGALSQSGRPLRSALAWSFSVREPRLAYVTAPGSGPSEVWRVGLEPGAKPEQITRTDGKLYDYAVAPDGGRLIFSVVNADGGLDLWLLDEQGGQPARLLVACGLDRCSVPAWSPDGAEIAYSREEAGLTPGGPNGPPRVWLADAASGATKTLYEDSQILGYGPVWSSDGSHLAFFDGSVSGLRVLDFTTRQDMVLPTLMGLVGSFEPGGLAFDYANVDLANDQAQSVLLRVELTTGDQTAVGDLPGTDFGSPVWAPNGAGLALALREANGEPGRQIYLLPADGGAARPILRQPGYTHGTIAWDPWGLRLAAQRLPLGVAFPASEIVVWTAADDSTRLLAKPATQPAWWP